MKKLWRVAQVLFGLLMFLSVSIVAIGALSKESGAIVFGIVLLVVFFALFLLMGKAAKIAPTEKPKNDFDVSIETRFKEGNSVLPPNCYCLLGIKENVLQMKPSLAQPPLAILNLSQITNIGVFTETEIIEKSRSVVGRGIAGGILFGSVGAVVGGLSGTNSKKRRESHRFVVINYIPIGATSPIPMTFEELSPFNKTSAFIERIKAGQIQKTINL